MIKIITLKLTDKSMAILKIVKKKNDKIRV